MNLKLKAALLVVFGVGAVIGISFILGWGMFNHPYITFPLLTVGIAYALYRGVLKDLENWSDHD